MTNMKTGITICMVSLAIACAAWAGSNDTTMPKVRCVFRLVSVEADANHGAMGRFTFRHHELRPIQLFGFGFTATNTFRVRFEEFQREVGTVGSWGRWGHVLTFDKWGCLLGCGVLEWGHEPTAADRA